MCTLPGEIRAFFERGDQEPWSFRTTYNLVRTEAGWKVLLCTAYSESALQAAAGSA